MAILEQSLIAYGFCLVVTSAGITHTGSWIGSSCVSSSLGDMQAPPSTSDVLTTADYLGDELQQTSRLLVLTR